MKPCYVIKGYKGIMDLDLTYVPEKYHAEMIMKHKEDIKQYRAEQRERPVSQRYEYTVLKSNRFWTVRAEKMRQRAQKQEEQWFSQRKRDTNDDAT